MGQTDQKPTFLSLQLTEIPLPPRAPKDEGTKQYVLPEPVPEANMMLSKVKQETQESVGIENGSFTANGIVKTVEHDPARVFHFPTTSQREFCHSSLTKCAPHLHASALMVKNK